MFDRAFLKRLSRQRLQSGRGNAILAAFLTALLGGGAAGTGGLSLNWNFSDSDGERIFGGAVPAWETIGGILLGILGIAAILGLLYSIFVSNVIEVGCRGWFLRYWRGENLSSGELFASFRIYKPAVVTALLRDLYVFLWSLLLIIPGIVKSYAYSMASYIIYENPNMDASEALQLSERLTNGAKGDLFVLDLSFIGWNLLSACTFGILGLVYVNPYTYTTHAAVYQSLKASAIQSGRLSWADFGQMPPAEPEAPAE